MRYGFTTGSCAAAAAKAACYMLLTGRRKDTISIQTPKGIVFTAQIEDIVMNENSASCAVIKDGGDDPDITTGVHVCASVTAEAYAKQSDDSSGNNDDINIISVSGHGNAKVIIDGGTGVGRVTRPGLDQPVGNAAINHVPRQMIADEVAEVMDICDYKGVIRVEISVPEGREIAAKTFNPRLGIEGGISILGTSGIVEPMSTKALLDTIRVELRQKRTLGFTSAAVTPGNYGKDFLKNTYGYDIDRSVKCSNYIGDTIDMAAELGFESLLLTGHIGKLIKVAGGIMNTHSKEGDCRMELLAAAAIRAGADIDTALRILDAVTTEDALDIISNASDGHNSLLEATMACVLDKIMQNLTRRAGDRLHIECMIYSNNYGMLAKSQQAEDMLKNNI